MSPMGQSRRFDHARAESAFPPLATKQRTWTEVRKVPIGDISMLFNRLVSLRDQDRREVIYAKNLPRNSPASCLRGIADDLRQRMRQNKKRLSLAPVLLQENRQIERAAETEPVPAHPRGIRQGHVGEALEQHGEQDGASGSSRHVRARAMMRAVA